MRVGLISFNARAGDAIGNHVAEKLFFFQERGSEVRIFLEDKDFVHPEIAPFYVNPSKSELNSLPEAYLTSCDLIIAEYGQYYSLLNWLPALAGKKPRIVMDYHGVTPPELWGPHNREAIIKGVQNKGLLWCADVILVHSRYTYNELNKNLGIPQERLYQVGFVVEMPLKPAEKRNIRLRKELGLEEATVLLYVGRLATNKRVPLLIDALQHLRNHNPDVHLLIVGNDTDVYQVEADQCRDKARTLGLADRVHFLGHRLGEALVEAYHAADLFVTSSAWESFCIPVVEAMACGLPVVAARNTALPDTLGSAGITFSGGDASDLAQTIQRVLPCPASKKGTTFLGTEESKKRIAVVNLQQWQGGISGIEKSLRTIATALERNGHAVQWFSSTSTTDPSKQYSRKEGFLETLPHSPYLLEELEKRAKDFEAIIIGPYLSRLSFEIASRFPEKTFLLPCFHDEPEARFSVWHQAYQKVAGFLYHSEEEKTLAQSELGFNHPNSVVIGTLLEPVSIPDNEKTPLCSSRYLIYCGRYTAEKNVPLLLDYASRYREEFPDRFQFVFLGAGNIPVPQKHWARDFGIVSEVEKKQLLSQADALVNLSCNESLSLVALEAWQQGTPVIGHNDCAVLKSHISQTNGGSTIRDYKTFAATLNDVWANPQGWKQKGEQGRALVQTQYEEESEFTSLLNQALGAMGVPLKEQLQTQGIERAGRFTRAEWQANFSRAVEQALHRGPENYTLNLEVRRRVASRTVISGRHSMLVPVQVHNWGIYPAVAEGPGQVVIGTRLREVSTKQWIGDVNYLPLPKLVTPGNKIPVAVPIEVPTKPGIYTVLFWAQSKPESDFRKPSIPPSKSRLRSTMRLIVEEPSGGADLGCDLLLADVHQELEEANRLQRLPEDYLDITQGTLARLKRKLKQKLLHNFKVAYVDVLSRQQTAFNRQILNIVQELAECCALLDHAVQQLQNSPPALSRKRNKQTSPVRSKDLPST